MTPNYWNYPADSYRWPRRVEIEVRSLVLNASDPDNEDEDHISRGENLRPRSSR